MGGTVVFPSGSLNGGISGTLGAINLSSAAGWFFVPGTAAGLPRSAKSAPGRLASAPPLPGTAAPLRRASSPEQLSGYGEGDSDSPLLSLDQERSLRGREGKKGEETREEVKARPFAWVAPGLKVGMRAGARAHGWSRLPGLGPLLWPGPRAAQPREALTATGQGCPPSASAAGKGRARSLSGASLFARAGGRGRPAADTPARAPPGCGR